MPYVQGDIVIVKFPYTNLQGSKLRPAIIVSNSEVNSSNDYIVVMLTTQNVRGRLTTTISNSDVSINFKPPHTFMNVSCKKIAILEDTVIHKKITEIVNQNKLEEIISLIKSNFDII